MKRKDVYESIEITDLFEGTPEQIIKNISAWTEQVRKQPNIKSINISLEQSYNNSDLVARVTRLENDDEYNRRIKLLEKEKNGELKRQARQEQKDYEKYLELKKKFENK